MRRPTRDPGGPTEVIEEQPTASLPPAAEPPPGAPLEEPPPDRGLWPWLLALLVLVLAGVVGAWLATRDNDQKAATNTAAVPAQTIAPAQGPNGAAREIGVPRVVGLKTPAALAALRRAGLTGATQGVFSSKPPNVVVAEHPAATTKVARGATVTLDVSKGKKPVPVPDVTGQQVAAAIETLKAQGMRATVVQVPSDQPAGQVVAQHPQAGETAAVGSAVRLNVSDGASQSGPTTTAPSTPAAAPVTVPDLQGQKLGDARKTLRRAGLVTEVRKVPSSLPKNSIVAQSPKPGTTGKRGDHVLVTVSLGPKKGAAPAAAQASVPKVVGEDESTAAADLRGAGFAVEIVNRSTTDQSQDGIVIQQTPAASRSAAAGSTVTIYVGRFGG